MSDNQNWKIRLAGFKSLPYYPLLLGCYPVVALLGFNISQVDPNVVWRPVLVLSLVTLAVMFLLKWLLRDWHRAALATTILILLFFTYGHLYSYLKTIEMSGIILGRHRQMLMVWLILAGLGMWWAGRKTARPQAFTPVLNLLSIFLLIHPTFLSTVYIWKVVQARSVVASQASAAQDPDLPLGYKPDIYFIVLDAYGRTDVLSESWGIDNTSFLQLLESRGFYIAECSQSNYAHTILSITSTLNLNYLDALTGELNGNMEKNATLHALGQDNHVRKYLGSLGYDTVAFATNFPFTEWKDAEHFYSPPPLGMNDFEILLARTSAWRVPMDMISRSPEQRSTDWYRQRTEYALRYLMEEVPALPGPKFVYAHLVIPHHPFVFGPNGEEVEFTSYDILDYSDYGAGYGNQVAFIDGQIENLIWIILQESPNPPIIVIQGDHGPSPFGEVERRMRILNAYYFPDNQGGLYPEITPVNSFRLILEKYYGQDFEPLEDVSRYSTYENPYEYQVVPKSCPKN